MKVSDVMTFGVASVSPDTVLADAARTLLDHRISSMPVVDTDGMIVGIITEGDLLRKVVQRPKQPAGSHSEPVELGEFLSSIRVEQVMTSQVESVERDTPVEAAIELLIRKGVRALPVSLSGRVVGMFSRPDIIRFLLESSR